MNHALVRAQPADLVVLGDLSLHLSEAGHQLLDVPADDDPLLRFST